jgi:MEMO1 family protein
MSIRRPDFAGSWYPSHEEECLRVFDEFERACVPRKGTGNVRGGIVPHAGWVFSGRIAYNVLRELARHGAEHAETVVLFGGHLQPTSPATVMTEGEFWTPLGNIPVDKELAEPLVQRLDLRRETPEQHSPDNTVELQAPLIRHLLPRARLVVIGAPPRQEMLHLADTVVEVARELGRRIVVVGSTDLTHYGPNYGWTPQGIGAKAEAWVRENNDPRFIDLACRLEPRGMIDEALKSSNACCPGAAAAAVRGAQKLDAAAGELLAYATSADVRRDTSFVGYAGILF